jgi:hypothetical protein
MNLKDIIDESIDTLWNQRQYGASNEWPRKDFVPVGARNDYNFPYQKGSPPVFPPTTPTPPNTADMPWPLQTVTEDLADSFVYLLEAHKKMKRCVKENPSISSEQKKNLIKLIKISKEALRAIEYVGFKIRDTVDLAGPMPPQGPE